MRICTLNEMDTLSFNRLYDSSLNAFSWLGNSKCLLDNKNRLYVDFIVSGLAGAGLLVWLSQLVTKPPISPHVSVSGSDSFLGQMFYCSRDQPAAAPGEGRAWVTF